MRQALLKIGLLLISALLTLATLEIGARVAFALKDIDYRVYLASLTNPNRLPPRLYINNDRQIRFALRPNTQVLASTYDFQVIYSINSGGFRDKEYPRDRSPERTRILALGDSFTFGEGVPYGDRFTDIVEAESTNLEILNFGVPGYGLDQELLQLNKLGLKFHPQWVIIFINEVDTLRNSIAWEISNNQIDIDHPRYQPLPTSPSTVYLPEDQFSTTPDALTDRSHLASYLKYRWFIWRARDQMNRHDRKLWGNIRAHFNSWSKRVAPAEIEQRTLLIIEAFNRLAQKNAFHLAIVNIDHRRPLHFLSRSEVPYFNLYPELAQQKKQYNLSFKYDPHYNPRTHHFIGRRLVGFINRLLKLSRQH